MSLIPNRSNETNANEVLQSQQIENASFKREITLFGGISILAGIMIGSGIFYLGSYVLLRSGMSLGLALLCWAVGGLITMLSGLCYAELGAMMPRAGGSYVYLREAYSPAIAFTSGFSSLLLSGSGSIAGLAVAAAAVINSLLPSNPLDLWQQKFIAILAIVMLTAFNIRGVKTGSLIQNFLMVAKLIPILVIIVCGLFQGKQTPDLTVMVDSNFDFSTWLQMLALGVVATLWAYEGWVNLNTVSEELNNPRRNLPLALILAIGSVAAIYLLFNFAVYRTLPLDFIATQLAANQLYLGSETAKALLGDPGMILVALGMLVAVVGSLNGCIMVFPRQYYAMAADGALLRSLQKLHPKHRTPANALLASMIVSILLVLAQDLNQLTSLVVFSGMIYKTLSFYAVIRLRSKLPQLERPYRVAGYPYIIYLTMAIMIALMANTFISDPYTSLVGLIVPLAGLVVFRASKR